MPNTSVPVDVGAGTGDISATATGSLLDGLVVANQNSGTPGTVEVYNGQNTADGQLVAATTVDGGNATTISIDVECPDGILVHRPSGNTRVGLHLRPRITAAGGP